VAFPLGVNVTVFSAKKISIFRQKPISSSLFHTLATFVVKADQFSANLVGEHVLK
jgi:hypothetical protein